MRVCVVGKYPPIEGGVSASTYWLAYGLAERGHQVSVVTNSGEVEPEYRMHMTPEDRALYAPEFPDGGGSVEVFQTEPLSPRMSHIPRHNPFATKLAGLTTQVVRSRGCEVIFTHYFEPYGIASYLASSWTGVPWIVRHAGSDIDRLTRIPELGTAYKEALRAADGVCSRMARRFLGIGVRPERLFRGEPHAAPAAFFNPGAEPMDIAAQPKTLEPLGDDGRPRPFDASVPTIGIYGKVGPAKGSFDLLEALAMLRRDGLRFNFLAMTQGLGMEPFVDAVRRLGLDDRTWILPFRPNWRVPSFIRACTAVCFLERDFSIKIHTPMVAYEVFSVGGCLVLSGEIAAKQASREDLADGENVLIVEDPKDHAVLAAQLRRAIVDPERARRIGAAGTALGKAPEAFVRYIDSWEQLLLRIVGRESTARSWAEEAAERAASGGDASATAEEERPGDELSGLMPWLDTLLPRHAGEMRERFRQSLGDGVQVDPVATGLAFCDFLRAELIDGRGGGREPSTDPELIEACLSFQSRRWRAQRDDEQSRREPAFAAPDRLGGAPVTGPRIRSLRPLRSRHAEVLELPYDVTPLFTGTEAPAINGSEVPALHRQPTLVCFLRAPNLQRTELKLTPAVAELLELCDGTRTTGEIVDTLAGDGSPEPLLRALHALYTNRVLVFCSDD